MHIVIEGQDGTGKDVQAEKLKEHLASQYPDRSIVLYSESGTTSPDPFVASIAKLAYGSHQDIDHTTRTLLYLINRYHQWQTVAAPVLSDNGIVITTRSWLSTLIYEGYNGGVNLDLIKNLHHLLLPESYFHPDHIVILTLDDVERQRRLAARDQRHATEVFKSASDSVQKTINSAYLAVAKDFDIPTLDTAAPVDQVFKSLLTLFFNVVC